MGDDLSFLVAGPMQPELKKLQAKHDQWLKDLKGRGLKPGDALVGLCRQVGPQSLEPRVARHLRRQDASS